MFNRCLLSKTPKRFTLVSFFILFIAISLFLDVIAVSYLLSLEVRPKHVFISFTFAMFTFFCIIGVVLVLSFLCNLFIFS